MTAGGVRIHPDAMANARAVADAVLFEGYMLYPYRANDAKNQVRWQFGVLVPERFTEVDPSERAAAHAEFLVEGHDVRLTVLVRFLQLQRRRVEAYREGGWFEDVDALDVGDATFLRWDEAVVCEHEFTLTLPGLTAHQQSIDFSVHAGSEVELLPDAEQVAEPIGRLVRDRDRLEARLSVTAEPLPGPYGVRRVRVRVANLVPWQPPGEQSTGEGSSRRPDALRYSLIAAHLLAEVTSGAFVSLIDTPEWARSYAESCEQVGLFPVLAGPPGDRSLALAAPIILYDHPEVAPESTVQFCDATEMDEMLTLRTLTLTEEERRLARGSDPRAASLVADLDVLPPALIDRLHGAIRSMTAVPRSGQVARTETSEMSEELSAAPWWDAVADAQVDPASDFVLIDGIPVGRGSPVRLRPGRRRADAQDMFLEGRTAHVEAVIFDVDGGDHLAVTLDDLLEPADHGHNPHGRFLYFGSDEVEPIEREP